MTITRISVPSVWRVSDTGRRFAVAEFELGPGPCGKTVKQLHCYANGSFFVVDQVCEDGSVKQFFYAADMIRGRIEVEQSA